MFARTPREALKPKDLGTVSHSIVRRDAGSFGPKVENGSRQASPESPGAPGWQQQQFNLADSDFQDP
jgi:hypothetical protein